MIIALVLTITACGAQSAAPTLGPPETPAEALPPPTAPCQELPMLTELTDEGLPPELTQAQPLWESVRGPDRGGAMRVSRLYANGYLYAWSDQRRVEGPGGVPRREAAPARWRLDARLSAAAVAEVEAVIKARFMGLTLPAPPGVVNDGTPAAARACVGGVGHAVSAPSAITAEEVRAVEHTLQRGVKPGSAPINNGP